MSEADNDPVTELVNDGLTLAQAMWAVQSGACPVEESAPEGGLTTEFRARLLRVRQDAAFSAAETTQAATITGAACQVAMLKEVFHLALDADPADNALDIIARFDILQALILSCLAEHGGALPPELLERYNIQLEATLAVPSPQPAKTDGPALRLVEAA